MRCPSNIGHAKKRTPKWCGWYGPLKDLLGHIEECGCANVVRNDDGNFSGVFSASFDDYEIGQSALEKDRAVTWAPIFLMSDNPEFSFHHFHVTLARNRTMYWTLYAKGYSHPEDLEKYQIRITVLPSSAENKTAPALSFIGSIASCTATLKDIMLRGQYLMFCDNQVKQLKGTSKTLFHFTVEIIKRQ